MGRVSSAGSSERCQACNWAPVFPHASMQVARQQAERFKATRLCSSARSAGRNGPCRLSRRGSDVQVRWSLPQYAASQSQRLCCLNPCAAFAELCELGKTQQMLCSCGERHVGSPVPPQPVSTVAPIPATAAAAQPAGQYWGCPPQRPHAPAAFYSVKPTSSIDP